MLDILVVDEDSSTRMGIAYVLGDAGHRVVEAADGATALLFASERAFDVIIADVRLPKVDGNTLARRVRESSPSTRMILMATSARVADAVAALREGVYDYVAKPFDRDRFPLPAVNAIAAERAIETDRMQARARLHAEAPGTLISQVPAMVELFVRIETVAASDAPVLITGESGTGKELIANAVHVRSARSANPFVAVNCAALPEALIEAELFGHERGAFTGAVKKRDGRFRVADGGTLLLDEVAEMSLPAQTKLLRVLQEGTFEPVGQSTPVHVDVRILSATHRNLKERVAQGLFREDLYYRLKVLDLHVPPLRERHGDLALLVEHFVLRFNPPHQPPPRITPRAWKKLEEYPFPGNVRELAHVIERAILLARGDAIDLPHLPSELSGAVVPSPAAQIQALAAATKEFERQYLLQVLHFAGGRRSGTAELLGISRKNLWEKMRMHGITDEEVDEGTGPIPLVPTEPQA